MSTLSSLSDTPIKAEKTENFLRLFFNGITVKNSKESQWCLPYYLQRFSTSDLACFSLSLDLQTPLSAMSIGWSSGKQRSFSLNFAIFWQITHFMLLTVA